MTRSWSKIRCLQPSDGLQTEENKSCLRKALYVIYHLCYLQQGMNPQVLLVPVLMGLPALCPLQFIVHKFNLVLAAEFNQDFAVFVHVTITSQDLLLKFFKGNWPQNDTSKHLNSSLTFGLPAVQAFTYNISVECLLVIFQIKRHRKASTHFKYNLHS